MYKTLLQSICIATIISALLFGTWIRYSNLFHVGFRFDIITTQYTWGKSVAERGFVDFWKNYNDYFDYLPGAVYLDTSVYYISTLFGGSEEAFALVLKSLNWIVEIIFVGLVYMLAKRVGKYSTLTSGLLAALAYTLPSYWFISNVWGQIDSVVVVLSIVALLLLLRPHKTLSPFYTTPSVWSGILFGAALWIKMQPILVLPVFILLLIDQRNKEITRNVLIGFLFSTVVMLAVPFMVNPERLGYVIGAPFTRESVVSRSAATFWTFIGTTRQDFLNEEFHPNTVYRTISLLGLLLYAAFSFSAVFMMFKPRVKQALERLPHIPDVLATMFKREAGIQGVFIIATISTVAYFEFMVKMYERYLHFGTMLAMLTLALLTDWKSRMIWFIGVVMLNIGNFLNLLGVYTWWNYHEPIWLTHWYQSLAFNQEFVSAMLTLGGLLLFFLVAKRFSSRDV